MNEKNKEIEVEVVETEVEVKEEGKIKKFFKQNGKKILLTGAAAIGVGLAYTIGKSNGGTNEFYMVKDEENSTEDGDQYETSDDIDVESNDEI